jgi:HTH-type transcriptional regulator / antitoxin HigA
MIKTDAQRARTIAQIEGFRRALAQAPADGKRGAALWGSYEGMIRQLEDEVREYDQLKSGEFVLPALARLDQIAPFIVKLRIAKGVSQTELAARLGVSKQVVSRQEEAEYQGVNLPRLQEIVDALGVSVNVTLTA